MDFVWKSLLQIFATTPFMKREVSDSHVYLHKLVPEEQIMLNYYNNLTLQHQFSVLATKCLNNIKLDITGKLCDNELSASSTIFCTVILTKLLKQFLIKCVLAFKKCTCPIRTGKTGATGNIHGL